MLLHHARPLAGFLQVFPHTSSFLCLSVPLGLLFTYHCFYLLHGLSCLTPRAIKILLVPVCREAFHLRSKHLIPAVRALKRADVKLYSFSHPCSSATSNKFICLYSGTFTKSSGNRTPNCSEIILSSAIILCGAVFCRTVARSITFK